MPKPVSMFKTDDGQLFEKLGDAVAHEQSVFVKTNLAPLFNRLNEAVHALPNHRDLEVGEAFALVISQDKELALEFQKVFAKLTLTSSGPVAKKRPAAKKVAKPAPPEPVTTPPAPVEGAPPPPALQ